MKTDPVREQQKLLEKAKSISPLKKFLGRCALIGIFSLAPAEVLTSDAVGAKTVQIVENEVHASQNKELNHSIQDAIVGSEIFGESAGLLWFIKRNKRARGSYITYKQMKAESKGKKGIDDDLIALRNDDLETKKRSPLLKVVKDLTQVNTIGTTSIGLIETAKGNPPDNLRVAILSGEITASWLAESEIVRAAARGLGNIPRVGHDIVKDIGWAWNTFTPDFTRPLNPGNFAVVAIATAIVVEGWRTEKYQQQHPELLQHRSMVQEIPAS